MIFLRALIFSSDETTQPTTANGIKSYLATHNADLKDLQGYIIRHGSSLCVQNDDNMVTIENSPGRDRLCAINNPKYYEKCLENMFRMVVECNSRISVQGSDTSAADVEHNKTKPGTNFAETKTNEVLVTPRTAEGSPATGARGWEDTASTNTSTDRPGGDRAPAVGDSQYNWHGPGANQRRHHTRIRGMETSDTRGTARHKPPTIATYNASI